MIKLTRLQTLLAERNLKLRDLPGLVGVDKATATRWSQRRIPAERVIAVEFATGIPRHELRPDLYPPQTADVNSASDFLAAS